jgi:hypothetical protein
MIIDAVLVLSDDQAVTASAQSSNILDLGAANLNLNEGTPLYANVIMTTAFGTSANTLTIDVNNDDSDPPTTKHQEIMPATATSALLTAGWLARVPIGLIYADLDGRYLSFYYTCSAALTSGTLFSFIGSH